MKWTWQRSLARHPRLILEEAGYHEFSDPNTRATSYVLRLDRGFYPRYHVYLSQSENGVTVDLHLDQKKAMHAGVRAHAGEYDGELVENELARIQRWFEYYTT